MLSQKCQHTVRYSIALVGAVAGCAELYNLIETLLDCTFALSESEAKRFALWLSLFLGVFFRLPSEYGLYYYNTLFKASDVLPEYNIMHRAHKKRLAHYTEFLVDILSALTSGGLTFASVFDLTEEEIFSFAPCWRYLLSSVFSLGTIIAGLGVNRSNRLSSNHDQSAIQEMESIRYGTFPVMKKPPRSYLGMLIATALIVGLGEGVEILYDGQETLLGFFDREALEEISCQNNVINFQEPHRRVIFIMMMILAITSGIKSAIVEGVHVEKACVSSGGFRQACQVLFPSFLQAAGNLFAAFVGALPALAAVATLPIPVMLQTCLLLSLFLSLGLSSSFVKGKYWQDSMVMLWGCACNACHALTALCVVDDAEDDFLERQLPTPNC